MFRWWPLDTAAQRCYKTLLNCLVKDGGGVFTVGTKNQQELKEEMRYDMKTRSEPEAGKLEREPLTSLA